MTLRDDIREALEYSDIRTAIKLASQLPDADLNGWGPTIKRAREAYLRPRFQQQLGRDPILLIQAGVAAVQAFLRGEHA